MVKEKINRFFIDNYKVTPALIKAPGRINLIGEHTDYNEGLVLPAAIEKAIYFAVAKNSNNTITVESFLSQPEKIVFELDGTHTTFKSFWGNYFKAILEVLISKNHKLSGMNCVFGGDIPIGSGLSSSAALCCGFIYAITRVSEIKLSRKEIVYIAQAAEHKIGLNCGIMDQYAVLFGKKGNALLLDCKKVEHLYVPINLEGYSWVLVNSNIKHNLAVDSEYNKRRVSCENIVKQVASYKSGVSSLRDVSFEDLEHIKEDVDLTDLKRANYVLNENDRVKRMMRTLTLGDAIKVGDILKEGHWAMSQDYEITTPELDLLVRTGESIVGVMGSRMMGGGFGGCTINLIKTENKKMAVSQLLETYFNETGIEAEVYDLQIDNGVHLIS